MTTMKVFAIVRSVMLRNHRSRAINDFIEAKDLGLVEVVAVEAVLEAVADLLQTITELISTPSMEL
jgi:hypothetical protein